MQRQLPRASIPTAGGHAPIRSGVSGDGRDAGEVVLKFLHIADWHLGRRFPSFPEEAGKRLSRARMDVIATILEIGRRNSVNAILCAGDLFDDPDPGRDFWEGLAKVLQ